MKRILIIGTSGSGKSTFANKVAERSQVPFFPTDEFYWEPNWKVATPEKVRQQVMNIIARDTWVLDGNFDDEHELVWKRAECIVWLDYSLMTICRQVVVRNLAWTLTRQQIWSGNRMTLQRAFSGILHAVKSHPLKRQKYPLWLAELSDTIKYRFCTSHEAKTWLQSLKGN